ncbi:ELWxxDGT repeat protein [Archangium gephyra]|uniref:ELWxxDGT repeat protein n=1 Tax=Archangium gephyra TaxID=48 RepID=UPI003B7737DA
MGNTLFFTATDVGHGTELWKSDGTQAGTGRVKDIVPGPGSAFPGDVEMVGTPFVNLDGILLFFVDQSIGAGASGLELWKSDGTEAGTVRVMAHPAWGAEGYPQFVHVSGGQVLFVAGDAAHGAELWRSDGTEAGTGLVVDLAPGPASSIEGALGSFGGLFYFFGHTGDGDSELWRTDGTAAGTTRVRDIRPGAEGSSFGYQAIAVIGDGAFFFEADDGVHGVELWKSDGTEVGTVLVKDITPGAESSTFSSKRWVDGRLFLSLFTSSGGELWKSDGTEGGTARIKVVSPPSVGAAPSWFREVNGLLLFRSADAAATAYSNTAELWRSDGTEAGTVMVKDITPGAAGSVMDLYKSGGTLFFTANDGVSGRELWKSDGTEAGTVMVKDIAPGGASSLSVRKFLDVNGTLFFLADETGSARPFQLWRSDGSEAGTVRVKDVSLSEPEGPPEPEGPRDRGCSASPGSPLGWAFLTLLPLSLRRRRDE